MTTLIIEPKKEPQDVPGVVIPPPGVSEPVIKNTPFFPDVDPKCVREEMRLEQTVSPCACAGQLRPPLRRLTRS